MSRSFVVLAIAVFCAPTFAHAFSPDHHLQIPEVQVDERNLCVDLNSPEVPASKTLTQSALADSAAAGKEISFYKALPSRKGGEVYYVFNFGNVSDLYIVYVANASQTILARKFMYGSLHYPCAIPHGKV